MKKRLFVWGLLLLLVGLGFSSCSDSGSSEGGIQAVKYNEYVKAFTSGAVSRNGQIYLVLSNDVDEAKLSKIKAEDVLNVSPSIKGSFAFSDSHTIVVTPTEKLPYGTTYSVKAKLDKLFDGASDFEFSFRTNPFQLNVESPDFSVTSNDDYSYQYVIHTLDDEDVDEISKLVDVRGSMTVKEKSWSSVSATAHQLNLVVTPSAGTHYLQLFSKNDASRKLEEAELISSVVPDPSSLTVFDARYVSEGTKCIEIFFNKNLDSRQSMLGLAYIVDNKSRAVEVKGNVLRLFPDAGSTGTVNVFLDGSIRSKSGKTLGSSQTMEVNLKQETPDVQFVGQGNIYPVGDKIIIPFKSIYTKGVKVRVYRIYGNNIGEMMARGDMNDVSSLTYLARPIVATTFFMDESTSDFTKWHTYAVDLTDLFKAEPGCMYRVELRLDYRLSAWPTDSVIAVTKEQMAAEDARILEGVASEFDTRDWYYMGSDFSYCSNNYDYYDGNWDDPSKPYYYTQNSAGRNIMATNIGLTALAGDDNDFTVVATDLLTAKGMSGVSVDLFNQQQQQVAHGETDGDGKVVLKCTKLSGRPSYVIAKKDNDVAAMRVRRGEELSTSTFDVSGEEVSKGLKGYIYGERGVWRPGDTLHLGFILNDREKSLPANHPVIMTIYNPLGQQYRQYTRNEGPSGVYAFNVPVAADAPTGSWRAVVSVGGVTFSKNLRVETIKPNRLKIDLKLPELLSEEAKRCNLHTEWLNGNPTHDLKYTIDAEFFATETKIKGYEGYVFDDPTESFSSQEVSVASGTTNGQGDASINFNPNLNSYSPGMLRCKVTTRVYEESGEFSTDAQTVNYSPYSYYVGIKSPNSSKQSFLPTGRDNTFDLVVTDPNGSTKSGADLRVRVYKVDWSWWWRSNSYEMAGYANSSYHTPVKDFNLSTGMTGKTSFKLNFTDGQWGTYLIVVEDRTYGHSTGILSYFDWPTLSGPRSDDSRETSTTLKISTDKKEYNVGETMTVSIPSSKGARAIVSICSGSSVMDMKFVECVSNETLVTIPIKENMMPNIYVSTTLIQPYSQSVNDMPIRLYGVQPITVTSAESHLNPEISCSDVIRPLSKCKLTVSEEKGRPMAYTLALVDEGLLDLTRFKTPNAWPVFNAREAFGVRQWDMYGNVVGAFGGRIEQMFSVGGDEYLQNGAESLVNRFTPIVYFDGPFVLKKGEKNAHEINIPNYNGRVRVMVVAADGSAYGSAEKSVIVRNPLMVTGTMPRQIGVGDEMTVAATVFASEASIKNATASIQCEGDLKVIGTDSKEVSFDGIGDKTVQFRVKAGNTGTEGKIKLVAKSGSNTADYTTMITMRTVSQEIYTSDSRVLEAGKKWNDNISAPGSQKQKIDMEVSSAKPLNMSSRIAQLMAYPHGCAEQTTSKAMPQLYLPQFTDLTDDQKKEVSTNVKAAIDKLLKYQTADGGIAYWPGGTHANEWCSAYVYLFVTEASAKGYYVSDDFKTKLRKHIARQVNNWTSLASSYDTYEAAFGLFALANAQKAEKGTMNRMKENASKLSETALSMLAASYQLSGNGDVATSLLKTAASADWYWGRSEIYKLIAQTLAKDIRMNETAENVRQRLVSNNWMSTVETSMSLYAMSQFQAKQGTGTGLNFTAQADKKEVAKVNTEKTNWTSTILENVSKSNLCVENKGKNTLYITNSAYGVAVQEPVKAADNGLSVSVNYSQDPSSIEQGTTFTATVTVRNTTGKALENIAVTHILPAGWEVLSCDAPSSSYYDVRDDRVMTYFDRMSNGNSQTIELTVSATYSGVYYLPAVTAEAMYDNTIMGCSRSGESIVK